MSNSHRGDQQAGHTIPLIEESIEWQRHTVDRGGYRFVKQIRHTTQAIDEVLVDWQVHVERRPIGRPVATDDIPQPHQEGDTYVIPVLEEVLVLSKQTMLVEELRVTRYPQERRHQQQVLLRKEYIDVERLDAAVTTASGAHDPHGQPPSSSHQDIPQEQSAMQSVLVAMFNSQSEAESAREQLLSAGYTAESVTMAGGSPTSTAGSATTDTHDENAIVHFFKNLFGDDHSNADTGGDYREAFRRGSYGLTVGVDASQIEQAESILNAAGAIDIDESTRQWQSEGAVTDATASGLASGRESVGTLLGGETLPKAGNVATAGAVGTTNTVAAGDQRTLQEIEEELKVGKRVVSRGGIRIYSRVIETPVEETVRLREEHANVQRRTVDRPATEADLAAFKEGSFEVRESAEEAVVEKTARVVGEVEIGKRVTERDETISETVRQTRVDVEDLAKAPSSSVATTDSPDRPKAS